MTPKQQAFCDYYIASGNATESAKKAGYSAKTAYSSGQRLLKYVEVKKYIEERALQAHNTRIADANEVLEFFTSTLRNEDYSPKDRLKAADSLVRVLGIEKNRGSENEGVSVNISFEDCGGGNG